MTLTPEQTKEIIENISEAEAVFTERGPLKGKAHLNKSYRFKLSDQPLRHISIARQATQSGMTVYVNQYSVSNLPFSNIIMDKVHVLQKYAKGHEGKTGDRGMAGSAARLPSLDPKNNDVLRLSFSSKEGVEQLLEWYLN